MHALTHRALLSLILVGTVTISLASSPAIGLVVAKGSFQLENSTVRGNATVFDGNTIETNKVSSHLQLNNGAQMRLGMESRAKIYGTRAVLEKGIGQLEASKDYQIEAR